MVFICKTLKYDPKLNINDSLYYGYRLVGMQKYDPNIIAKNNNILVNKNNAVCSTSKRTIQTAQYFGFMSIKTIPILNEIKFDLGKLLTEKEFNKYGSSLVRTRFIEAFISNDLNEKRQNIQNRINLLIDYIKNNEFTTYFSHSFFMKILQAYIESKYQLFESPEILYHFIDANKPTYEYGKGFVIKL